MLNQNLPDSVLQVALSEYSNQLDFILKEIGEQRLPLVNDKSLMGKLHHALNISEYSKSSFREKLLRHAKKDMLLQFFDAVKFSYSISPSTDELSKLIKKASLLPWSDNHETKSFVKIFGYEDDLIPNQSKPIESIRIITKSENPFKLLKDYQSKIFFQSMDLVIRPWSRFIIRMPTGAGKTRTAMEIVSAFLNQGLEMGKERQVVWIADKNELCEQAVEAMENIWPHIGKKDISLYRLWGKNKFKEFDDFAFIVATYSKLHSVIGKNQSIPKPHLIISDEAHNVIAPTYKESLEELEENETRTIGLTATPIRGVETNENDKLLDYFDERIIEIDSGFINTIEYLQGKGYLAHYTSETIPSNREFKLSKEERVQYAEERDLPPSVLERIANDEKRNIVIVEYLKKLKEDNSQVLYFAPSVKQSKFMCAILLTLGAKAAHIDSSTPSEYRREVVAKFRSGEIKFIFNYGVFSTGFDAPNIDVVFIARPTSSIVLHQQMIGRGMRGPEMGGTETFRLYRITDELPSIELADDYFSDIWNS